MTASIGGWCQLNALHLIGSQNAVNNYYFRLTIKCTVTVIPFVRSSIQHLYKRPVNGCHHRLIRRILSDLVADLHIPDMVGLCVYFADIGQFYYQNVIASPFQPRIRRPSSIRKEGRLLVALF